MYIHVLGVVDLFALHCLFMADDAQQFYNAWSGVFETKGTKKLLRAWHVDRAWRAALNEKSAAKS